MELPQQEYNKLIQGIGQLLIAGRERAAQEVNSILVQTYWEIGRYILEFEQRGKEKAEYESQLFDRLSTDLTQAYGKGLGRSNLLYMRKLYLFFQKSGTLSHKLTWSHYYEILKADSDFQRPISGQRQSKLHRSSPETGPVRSLVSFCVESCVVIMLHDFE